MSRELPHIAVCICTFNRPVLLKRLLMDLDRQETENKFTYSAVVADNDPAESAKETIAALDLGFQAKYCAEPRRGIAFARNKVLENAEGDFVAFIDDDEFPVSDWLLTLFKVCEQYGSDGVLGRSNGISMSLHRPGWSRASFTIAGSIRPACGSSGQKREQETSCSRKKW